MSDTPEPIYKDYDHVNIGRIKLNLHTLGNVVIAGNGIAAKEAYSLLVQYEQAIESLQADNKAKDERIAALELVLKQRDCLMDHWLIDYNNLPPCEYCGYKQLTHTKGE